MGGWHDSDQCHGLGQATGSSYINDEERIVSRAAQAHDPAGRVALALVTAAPAFAATSTTPTTGYSKPEPNAPTPNSGTSPSKATKTPAKTVSPATTSTATKPAKASTLPFTGFDLRWTVGGGLLLVCAGGSIMVMQRRRRDTGL
jgi:hypothetical protein